MLATMSAVIPGEIPGEYREYLADSRVRAVLLRPGPDLRWRSDVARPMTADLETEEDRVFGDGGPWLVSAVPPTATFARSLGAVLRAFEKVAQRPTQDAIYKFVQTFGWLGHLESVQVVRSGPGFRVLHVGGSPLAGEALGWWLDELASFGGIRQMWQAVVDLTGPDRLEDPAKAARSSLRKHIAVGGDEIRYRLPMPSSGHATAQPWVSVVIPGLERRVPKDDLAALGTFVVCHVINEQIRDHAHPTLMPFQGRAMSQVPDCLLGAIYLRLANEVSSLSKNPKRKQCPVCKRTFDAVGNRVYDDDTCKWKKKYLHRTGRWPLDGR
jgi:hypothetical protein